MATVRKMFVTYMLKKKWGASVHACEFGVEPWMKLVTRERQLEGPAFEPL